MKETIFKKEQVLLFLNRRGFANHPVCAVCGEPLTCKNCAISLTYHKKADTFNCHYCGYGVPKNTSCSNCGSTGIMLLGLGTEKVEEAVKSIFPISQTARLDRDAVSKKGSLVNILKSVRDKTTDILVGTQMVAKGHDFPNITLVGILCADLSLNFPDFRSSENTFQILAQVAGRAGRGGEPGNVILQTFNPDHYAVETAKNQDFKSFYEMEAPIRQAMAYPPFSRIALFKISGKDKEKTDALAEKLGEALMGIIQRDIKAKGALVLGPIESPISRIASVERRQVILKAHDYKGLSYIIRTLTAERHGFFHNRNVTVSIDIDPYNMM